MAVVVESASDDSDAEVNLRFERRSLVRPLRWDVVPMETDAEPLPSAPGSDPLLPVVSSRIGAGLLGYARSLSLVLWADHEVIPTSGLILDPSVFSSVHTVLHGVEQHQHLTADAAARAREENERAKELLLIQREKGRGRPSHRGGLVCRCLSSGVASDSAPI